MIVSCTSEEETINRSPGLDLIFSTDTLLFDTLIAERVSVTKRIQVKNPHNQAIQLDDISLAGGQGSSFDIVINGRPQSQLNDLVILGNDSILILVDLFIESRDQDLPFLLKDSIVFQWNQLNFDIKLVAWGQDAIFLNGERICDQVWDAERPYVVYDRIEVEEDCELTIEAGTRVYFDSQAEMLINGRLNVHGDSSNEVHFRSSRMDGSFKQAPGQWSGLIFSESSTNNMIENAIIENAINGIELTQQELSPNVDLRMTHSSVRHVAEDGIFSAGANLEVVNSEIFNCGSNLVYHDGGTISYDHCTLSNHPTFFVRSSPAVVFVEEESVLSVQMSNSIIWGELQKEIFVDDQASDSVTLTNNIIRYDEPIEGNQTSTSQNYPGFSAPLSFDYRLNEFSPAINSAEESDLEVDKNYVERDSIADIGAYEYFIQEEE